MAEGCPAKCAKFLLIIFNIIFWLSGAALLAVGIWLLVDDTILQYFNIIYVDGDDQWFKYASYVLIAVGAFTFVTGFAGCCGAIKESPCLLGVYIFLLVIVMLVEITAGVLAFVFKNRIEQEVEVQLAETFMKENFTNGVDGDKLIYTGFGTSMNLFQQEFKCCGVNSSVDYRQMEDTTVFGPDRIPYSCCQLNSPDDRATPQKTETASGNGCPASEPMETSYASNGCKEKLMDWLEKQSLILIGLGIGIACLEIFGIIFAVCLCRNPTSDKYD